MSKKNVTNCAGGCGAVLISSHGPQRWCRKCYLSFPFPRLGITVQDVLECGSLGMTAKDSAKELGVSYVQLRRVIHRFGLRTCFPARGGAGRWLAERGYAN